MKLLAAMVALTVSFTTPAVAEPMEGQDCTYSNVFEGPGKTTIMFGQSQENFDQGDNVVLMAYNDIWSLKRGDNVGKITFEGPDATLWSEATAEEHSFGFLINWKHFSDVFDEYTGSVGILRNGKEIDRVKLSVMRQDFLALDRCRSKRVAEKAERERKAEIDRNYSKDPFAE